VLQHAHGPVLVLTLNRPEARNAVNLAVAQALAAGLRRLDTDPDLAVGVLAANGAAFCAGMDLKAFLDGERPVVGTAGFGGLTAAAPTKPLVAAVEGPALAGGFELVLSCDLVVAGGAARFGLPEVRRGLVAAAGGVFRLPRRIPYLAAMEMVLTGEPVTAGRALELGLVNRLVEPGQALAAALELAGAVATNAPLAVQASVGLVRDSWSWDDTRSWREIENRVATVAASADATEGARAFAERRPAHWLGR
jgi:enoyl-CoA hydratase